MIVFTFKQMKESVLVIFGDVVPKQEEKWWQQFGTVVASTKLQPEIRSLNLNFVDLEELIGPGSVRDASIFTEELSRVVLPHGSRVAKSVVYKGYELWWMHCHGLFLYFCLPYTQYSKLLDYLRSFRRVYLYKLPYKNLFLHYLHAHGCEVKLLSEPGLKSPSFFHFGVFLQVMITTLSLPVLVAKRHRLLFFIGDKFEKNHDYDFRVRFIYEELRRKHVPFVEFIRSLEPWGNVLRHALIRKRPVVYYEAIASLGRFCSIISGGRRRAMQQFGLRRFDLVTNPEVRFKFLLATHYLRTVYDDIWAIRITQWILRVIGNRVGLIEIASERSFHTVLGCKLNLVPTVGILHGVTSRYFVTHDFMPGFDGEKTLSVDAYGVWSQWWKEYYLKNGKAYRPDQLFVSGPMRPLEVSKSKANLPVSEGGEGGALKVLFISEQLGYPVEVLPYLSALVETEGIDLYVKFRPYRDGFEEWLKEHRPELLNRVKILRGSVQEAVSTCDVVVGSHSTAALEALFQLKPPIFYRTGRWGDYFDLKEYDPEYKLFAETPTELIDYVFRGKKIPTEVLGKLQERFFGDPYKNGSKWVVDRCLKHLSEQSEGSRE
mgnify:CR=1 FL=1